MAQVGAHGGSGGQLEGRVGETGPEGKAEGEGKQPAYTIGAVGEESGGKRPNIILQALVENPKNITQLTALNRLRSQNGQSPLKSSNPEFQCNMLRGGEAAPMIQAPWALPLLQGMKVPKYSGKLS